MIFFFTSNVGNLTKLCIEYHPDACQRYSFDLTLRASCRSLYCLTCGSQQSAQTGVAINTDATHIFNDYGVQMANTVDLRTLAKANLVATSSRSLAGLTACLLGKQLPKENIRFSRWGCPHLSDAQRDYATRDAVASVLVYEAMFANREPIVRAPPEPDDVEPGSKVRA